VTAAQLARAYARHLAAVWRGEPDPAFAAWLAAHRGPGARPAPAVPPAAVSAHGGGGRGLHWYETAEAVLGHVPGQPRVWYRVPRGAVPPAGG
jgi:hypothetical protein